MAALEELIKYISQKRSNFDNAFLVEALEKQKVELLKLSEVVVVHISPADEDTEYIAPALLIPWPFSLLLL